MLLLSHLLTDKVAVTSKALVLRSFTRPQNSRQMLYSEDQEMPCLGAAPRVRNSSNNRFYFDQSRILRNHNDLQRLVAIPYPHPSRQHRQRRTCERIKTTSASSASHSPFAHHVVLHARRTPSFTRLPCSWKTRSTQLTPRVCHPHLSFCHSDRQAVISPRTRLTLGQPAHNLRLKERHLRLGLIRA